MQHGRRTEWGWFSGQASSPVRHWDQKEPPNSPRPIFQRSKEVFGKRKDGRKRGSIMTWGIVGVVRGGVADCPPHGLRQASGPSRVDGEIFRPQAHGHTFAALGLALQAPFCTTSQHRVISCSAGPPFPSPRPELPLVNRTPGIQNVCPFDHQLHRQAPMAQALDDPYRPVVHRCCRLQTPRIEVIIALPSMPPIPAYREQ